MQMRGVLVGLGVLGFAIAQGEHRALAESTSQLRLIAAHGVPSSRDSGLPQAASRPAKPAAGHGRTKPQGRAGAAGSASQPVGNLTYQQIFDYQMASNAPGNPAAGRPIFEKQCSKCHKFGSIGNEVGPDLTALKSRFKKKDVLESVLWPSKVVADQYQAVVVETKDGESHTGIVVREDASRLLLKTAEQTERGIVIPKADITDRRVTGKSLMPEGLLKDFTQQDIRNLVAFLLGTPPA